MSTPISLSHKNQIIYYQTLVSGENRPISVKKNFFFIFSTFFNPNQDNNPALVISRGFNFNFFSIRSKYDFNEALNSVFMKNYVIYKNFFLSLFIRSEFWSTRFFLVRPPIWKNLHQKVLVCVVSVYHKWEFFLSVL